MWPTRSSAPPSQRLSCGIRATPRESEARKAPKAGTCTGGTVGTAATPTGGVGTGGVSTGAAGMAAGATALGAAAGGTP
ncbi:hypothetical protein ACE1SV_38860 [Streptomyces sennicomposti]